MFNLSRPTMKSKESWEAYTARLTREVQEARQRAEAKRRRAIESGLIKGGVTKNGLWWSTKPKGIQNWYDTRTLIEKVAREIEIKGYCPINKKHCLQIRGKHLRRLLKKMPYLEQRGNTLVDTRAKSV
jgi:hypothetical protein